MPRTEPSVGRSDHTPIPALSPSREGAEQHQNEHNHQDKNCARQQQQRAQQQQEQTQPQQRQQQQQHAQQQGERLSQQRQQQLIQQQQQRLTQYRQHEDQQQQQGLAQRRIDSLQQQRRTAQYRSQQDYAERLSQQQARFRDDRNHDYDHDPYYYTAPIYRYRRGGNYYEINQYGADVLRQAVNYGYEEGFRTGRADREDRWRSSYQDSYAYQDANYGYSGYYVDQDDYNFYFREGFRRGYEDGYASRYHYGRYSDGRYSVLEIVVSRIFGFQPLR